jgi:predicted RNA binding protein YcfA (HicA-like mRNA interferase family)
MPTKVKEIIRLIENDGWFLVSTKGSHRQFKHGKKSGRVTVAGKLSDDLSPAMENSIRKQAVLLKAY